MGLLKEFKDFAMKGSVVDMAVGVVIGGAFGKIVSSLVSDVIMPVVGVISGGDQFAGREFPLGEGGAAIGYGNFLQTILDFLIVAFAIFMAVKAMNKAQNLTSGPEEEEEEAPKPPAEDIQLLREIRDSLAK